MFKKLILTIAIILNLLIAKSQEIDFYNGIIDTNKKSVSFDFEVINNLIIIPLQINGSDTLHFILDTGIKPTLLTSFDGEMGFNVAQVLTIRGLGQGDDLPVYLTYGNKIVIANKLVLNQQSIFVLQYDRFELSKKMGMPINGIIGYSVFENFIIKIDYINSKITFYDPKKFEYKNKYKSWTTLPLTIFNGKPYTFVEIGLNKDTIINANVLVDLGASDALWLLPKSNDSIPKNKYDRKLYLGQGLNGDIFGYQSKVHYIRIGDKNFLKNVCTSYPDELSINIDSTYDMPGRNGTIGSEVLRRFYLIIDYPNKQLLLKRNVNYSNNFYFDLSGLELQTPMPGLRFYSVYFVHENSPASEAGFKVEDKIINIDNFPANNYTMNDIFLMLHSREGRKINFLIDRDGVQMTLTLQLRDYRTQD